MLERWELKEKLQFLKEVVIEGLIYDEELPRLIPF